MQSHSIHHVGFWLPVLRSEIRKGWLRLQTLSASEILLETGCNAKIFQAHLVSFLPGGSTIELLKCRDEFGQRERADSAMRRRSKYCAMLTAALERECRLA
jgi:hypothetical protein